MMNDKARRATSLLGAGAAALLSGCGPDLPDASEITTPELSRRSDGIRGGVETEDHPAVVGIAIQHSFGIGACTGSLIAPNMVLTAQHCVADSPEGGVVCGETAFEDPFIPSSFLVTTEPNLPFNPRDYYRVSEVHVPSGDKDLCGNDMAVLILTENIPYDEAFPITPRVDSPVEAGELFDAIGYGHTGDGSGAGTRRIITDREVICEGQDCVRGGAPVTRKEWIGNDGTCEGDSGGPALDKQGRVLGALSRGGDGCTFPIYSAVYNWGDWLRGLGLVAAEKGGYEPALWITAGISDDFDADDDGVDDAFDNCPFDANPEQEDVDEDRIGDACDPTDDREGAGGAGGEAMGGAGGELAGGAGGAGGEIMGGAGGEGADPGDMIGQDDSDGGGGSCSTQAGAPGAGWSLALLALIGLRRRKTR